MLPTAGFQSSALRCELRLRERLQDSEEKGSRRMRAEAALDALQEVSRMVSAASSIMPILLREIMRISLSDRVGGGSGDSVAGATLPQGASRLFHFEVVGELEAEIASREAALRQAEAALRQQARDHRETDEAMQVLQEVLRDRDGTIAGLEARLAVHDAAIAEERKQLAELQEEYEALDRRIARAEEVRRVKEEMLNDTQVHPSWSKGPRPCFRRRPPICPPWRPQAPGCPRAHRPKIEQALLFQLPGRPVPRARQDGGPVHGAARAAGAQPADGARAAGPARLLPAGARARAPSALVRARQAAAERLARAAGHRAGLGAAAGPRVAVGRRADARRPEAQGQTAVVGLVLASRL